MSPQAFNVVLFVADFAAAVDRLQRRFGSRAACPSVPWHRALRGDELFVACQGDGSVHVIDTLNRRHKTSFQAGTGCESLGFF